MFFLIPDESRKGSFEVSCQTHKYQAVTDIVISSKRRRREISSKKPFFINKRYHNNFYALILTESLQVSQPAEIERQGGMTLPLPI